MVEDFIADPVYTDKINRRCLRLLRAVHELHKQGFQDLAIHVGMAPSGFYWRCTLVPYIALFKKSNGTLSVYHTGEFEEAHHSSANEGNDYFGWQDAKQATANDLAQLIQQRFPRMIAMCKRQNYAYTGWFTLVLGKAEEGALPVMYDEYMEHNPTFIHTTANGPLPTPPAPVLHESDHKPYFYRPGPHLKEDDDWHTAYIGIIDGFRSSDVLALPEYPVGSNDIYELGAYWEGAIYYIQCILGFSDIESSLIDAESPPKTSGRWKEFFLIWNSEGQWVFLKAFLVRTMLRPNYPKRVIVRKKWEAFLADFEGSTAMEATRTFHTHNPFYGGNNPLHLGNIIAHIDVKLIV